MAKGFAPKLKAAGKKKVKKRPLVPKDAPTSLIPNKEQQTSQQEGKAPQQQNDEQPKKKVAVVAAVAAAVAGGDDTAGTTTSSPVAKLSMKVPKVISTKPKLPIKIPKAADVVATAKKSASTVAEPSAPTPKNLSTKGGQESKLRNSRVKGPEKITQPSSSESAGAIVSAEPTKKESTPTPASTSQAATLATTTQVTGKSKRKHYETPEDGKMTMKDLIYCNPTTNKMKAATAAKKKRKKVKKIQEEEGSDAPEQQDQDQPEGPVVSMDDDAAELVVEPSEAANEAPLGSDGEEEEDDDEDEEDGVIAPQMKIGPDGNIIVDEESLVQRSKGTTNALATLNADPNSITTYASYSKRETGKTWRPDETTLFYKALSSFGTDFYTIAELFPGRSHRQIKKKFQREDKDNKAKIDKALSTRAPADMAALAETIAANAGGKNQKDSPKKKKPRSKG